MPRIKTSVAIVAIGTLAATGLVVSAGPASAIVSKTWGCTNSDVTWTVPAGVTSITIDAYGAQGGTGKQAVWSPDFGVQASPSPVGGLGGRTVTTIPVTPGEELDVTVGCRGDDGEINITETGQITGNGGLGGWGGAGSGGSSINAFNNDQEYAVGAAGGGGGGASSVVGVSTDVWAGGGGGSGGGVATFVPGNPDTSDFAAAGSGGAGGGDAGLAGSDGIGTAPGRGGQGATDGLGGAGGDFGGDDGDTEGGNGGPSDCTFGSAAGGGGGGGFTGGGGGGAPAETPAEQCAAYTAQGGGGGGGGGEGQAPDGAYFETGIRENDGQITISYETQDQPDAQIRKGTSLPFVGNDVYPPGEQKVTTDVPGNSQTFQVKLENDGSRNDRLRILGSAGVPGIVVKYKVGSTVVTSAVLAGSYQTPVLAPGASMILTINLNVKNSVPVGTRHGLTVRATSRNDASLFDAVTGVVKVT
jgi:hypothetical protein